MRLITILMIVFLQSFSSAAHADESTLAWIEKSGAVTATDIEIEGERFPPEIVKSTFTDAENTRRIASNLVLRRTLAKEAEALGLDKDPKVVVRLRLARERVLSDTRIQQFDGVPPDEATLQKLALAEYNAFPEKYRITEAVRLSHILIGRYRADGKQLAESLLADLKSGKSDFGNVAKMYSDDASTKEKLGDLGFWEQGKLRPEIDKLAFKSLTLGALSGVIETELGWHIVRLDEKRMPGKTPFEAVKPELVQKIARDVVEKRRLTHVGPLEETVRFDDQAIKAFIAKNR